MDKAHTAAYFELKIPCFSFWFLSEKYLKGRLKNSFQTTFWIVEYQF